MSQRLPLPIFKKWFIFFPGESYSQIWDFKDSSRIQNWVDVFGPTSPSVLSSKKSAFQSCIPLCRHPAWFWACESCNRSSPPFQIIFFSPTLLWIPSAFSLVQSYQVWYLPPRNDVVCNTFYTLSCHSAFLSESPHRGHLNPQPSSMQRHISVQITIWKCRIGHQIFRFSYSHFCWKQRFVMLRLNVTDVNLLISPFQEPHR